jgi:hypothetical protein
MSVFEFFTFDGTNLKTKRRLSSAMALTLSSVLLGASALEIKETSGAFDFSNLQLTNIAAPTSANHAATKSYVDTAVASVAAGFDPKAAMQLKTVAALPACTASGSGAGKTLTGNANGALVVDGITVALNYRILVDQQSGGINNGYYSVTQVGSGAAPFILTRTTDFDGTPAGEVSDGAYTLVTMGTQAGTNWYLVVAGNVDPVVDTDALTFAQASMPQNITASGGLQRVANDISVKLEASSPSLQVVSGELGVKLGFGLEKDSGGATVKLDGSTLSKSGTGLKVASLGITATEIATDAVIASKIQASAVTTAKLAPAAVTQGKYDFTRSLTATNSVTVNQFCYLDSGTSAALAIATNTTFGEGTEFCCVQDASITAAAAGLFVVEKGKLLTGFTGLTHGAPVYLSRTTSGGYQQDLTGFVATNQVVRLGFAEGTTSIRFDPMFEFEY